jgi:hypothetical protein
MLLWDGDLLNFHFAGTDHSLSNWGVSYGSAAAVPTGIHDSTQDLFASESLNGHWTLDNLMPLLSAEHLIDATHSDSVLPSSGLTGTVDASPAAAIETQTFSALVLPTVLKVEEPFAIPLPVDTIANLGADTYTDLTFDLPSSDLLPVKPNWTIAMRMAMRG